MRGRWVGCNVGGFYLCCGGRVVFCMRGFLGLSGAAVFLWFFDVGCRFFCLFV